MVLLDFDSDNLGFGHSGMVRVGFEFLLCIAFFYPWDNYEIVTIDF